MRSQHGKLFVLLSSSALLFATAIGASHRLAARHSGRNANPAYRTTQAGEKELAVAGSQQPAAAAAIGPIDLKVIAGGGGTSTGGSFNLSGTLGQATTSQSSGGQFSLAAGFWAAVNPLSVVSISGTITYQDSATGVKNVTVMLSGAQSGSTTTDASGNYSFPNLPTGSYTITCARTGDVNGISNVDATQAAQKAAGTITLSPNKAIAADATNDGSVSNLDATRIAQAAVGVFNAGIAGTWKFFPANITLLSTVSDQTGQNFAAMLVGDVTGNWTPPAGPISNNSPNVATAGIPVSLPVKADPSGGTSTIGIMAGDLTGQNVTGYDLDVAFDPTVLTPQAAAFDASGTLSSDLAITQNISVPGHLTIDAFSFNATPRTGSGTLLKLKFNVVGAPGATTPLTWSSSGPTGVALRFNEGTPAANPINGQFTVASPSAAPASVSGKLLTSLGQPLGGVLMTLSGGPRLRRAITDANGNYMFTGLDTNGFYIVTPFRANYAFNPSGRSFSLLGNVDNAVFTAFALAETANPLDTPEFFVRQQYLDFLGREPDQGGFEYWSDQIERCSADQNCTRAKRIDVSNAFFYEAEFQETGAYVYRMYRAAFGNSQPFPNPHPDPLNPGEENKLPSYQAFAADRTRVVGGANLAQSQLDLANAFAQRNEFLAQYPASEDGPTFVDAVLATIRNDTGVDLTSQRTALINLSNSAGRGAVMYRLADDNTRTNPINNRAFIDEEYNRAFVATQYFGYLRRDADIGGFLFWLGQVNSAPLRDTTKQHAMVCAFVTAAEYQLRFSSVVTHTNRECSP